MKAYICNFNGAEWVDYVHAEDRQQARIKFWNEWCSVMDMAVFIDVEARRVPFLDDLPLTAANIYASGNDEWRDSDGGSYACKCDICKPPVVVARA